MKKTSCTALLLALASFALPAASQEVALETTYASGNGQNGNMFDIRAEVGLVLTRVDMHIDSGTTDVEIYSVPSTYVGNEANPAAWTLVGTALGVSGGGDVPQGGVKTSIPLTLDIPLKPGQTIGLYCTTTGNPGVNYTNGTSEGAVFAADGSLTFFEGRGVAYPFGSTFSPRVWNGTLYYKLDCNGNGIKDSADLAANPDLDIDGDGQLDTCSPPALMADVYDLSLAAGGTQTFTLTAPFSGGVYHLLGSEKGTSPGVMTPGGVLPLNRGDYLVHTSIHPALAPLSGAVGTFAASGSGGTAKATFTLTPGMSPATVGTVLHHAWWAIDPVAGTPFISNPVPLRIGQ